jgi:hypothetical protein
VKSRLVVLGVLFLVACGDDDVVEREPASPAPPPDAGTQAGHGADPRRVAVPERDASPPTATVALFHADGRLLAETSHGTRARATTLDEPRLRGTTTGSDENGGVARVRVSIREEIECRDDEASYRRLRTRYFPPPQVERIRSNPGARLPTRAERSLPIRLSAARCAPGRLTAVHGELWGEAINGSGLEAVTPHLKFVYQAD